MNEEIKYLTPKKSLEAIDRERKEGAQANTIDLYEAVADLFEQVAALQGQVNTIITKIGGTTK